MSIVAPNSVPDSETSRRHAAGEDPGKREQILRGAWDCVMAEGFDGATMAGICRAAGVSKGTLYVYFRDKEDLFVALIEAMRQRHLERVGNPFEKDAPIAERLSALGRHVLEVMTSPGMLRLQRRVIAVAERLPDLSLRFYEAGAAHMLTQLSTCLGQERARGSLTLDDPELAAQQFLDLLYGAVWRRRLFGSLTEAPNAAEIDRYVAGAVQVFLGNYGPRGPLARQ